MDKQEICSDGNRERDDVKVIKVLESNKKMIRAVVSRNGSKPKTMTFEKTKSGLHDQYGHHWPDLVISQ